MDRVKTQITDKILVSSPYFAKFVSSARNMGGKWDANRKVWVFDRLLLEQVKQLLCSVYGDDGMDFSDLVDVQLTYDDISVDTAPFFACGALVAAASGRDSGAKLGTNVIVLSGGFTSGGSVKYWKTVAKPNTVVVIKNVPRKSLDYVDPQFKPIIIEHENKPPKIFSFQSTAQSPEKIRKEFEAKLAEFFQS